MEPSEIGLLLGEVTRHSLHEDIIGRHGSQPTGFFQGQDTLHPPIPLIAGRPQRVVYL
jgi:hypothetical protein